MNNRIEINVKNERIYQTTQYFPLTFSVYAVHFSWVGRMREASRFTCTRVLLRMRTRKIFRLVLPLLIQRMRTHKPNGDVEALFRNQKIITFVQHEILLILTKSAKEKNG